MIKVLGKKILVEKIAEEVENTTSSGIWFASAADSSKLQAAIVKTKGDEVSERIKEGSKVFFNNRFAGTPFDDNLVVLEESQIVAYED